MSESARGGKERGKPGHAGRSFKKTRLMKSVTRVRLKSRSSGKKKRRGRRGLTPAWDAIESNAVGRKRTWPMNLDQNTKASESCTETDFPAKTGGRDGKIALLEGTGANGGKEF